MEKKYFVATTAKTNLMENVYKPAFYRVDVSSNKSSFDKLCKKEGVTKYDTIASQLFELMRCRNPSMDEKQIKEDQLVEKYLAEQDRTIENYGVWVYYPWKKQALHILDEEEFIEVRTNRNKLKITQKQQELLRQKIVGIAGLSVGRAVATTIALERIAGEIRLADFDTIELSNLNRINSPLIDLGINKAVSAAREITEIDPFIKVKCFIKGLHDVNMDSFFIDGGKMDLFIEECDDIAVKVSTRLKCKDLEIPVLMETNDNCVIDVERFDLEPSRKIFHGRLDGIDLNEFVEQHSSAEKIAAFSKMLDFELLSDEMKLSMKQINKNIVSWPQLFSEVTLGASILSILIRQIFLGRSNNSFRKSIDIKKNFGPLQGK